MATICTVVLTLAMPMTATCARSPISAIHSRSAEMAISRPMMMVVTTANTTRENEASRTRGSVASSTSAAATISLSATGSRKAPKRELCPRRRAR